MGRADHEVLLADHLYRLPARSGRGCDQGSWYGHAGTRGPIPGRPRGATASPAACPAIVCSSTVTLLAVGRCVLIRAARRRYPKRSARPDLRRRTLGIIIQPSTR